MAGNRPGIKERTETRYVVDDGWGGWLRERTLTMLVAGGDRKEREGRTKVN